MLVAVMGSLRTKNVWSVMGLALSTNATDLGGSSHTSLEVFPPTIKRLTRTKGKRPVRGHRHLAALLEQA